MNIREILETRLIYPTPDLISPYAAAIQEHTDKQWIDGELRSLLPEAARENYNVFVPVIWLQDGGPLRQLMKD